MRSHRLQGRIAITDQGFAAEIRVSGLILALMIAPGQSGWLATIAARRAEEEGVGC